MTGTIEMRVETAARMQIGMTGGTMIAREITVGKEIGIAECTGMFKVEYKTVSLAGDIQLQADLTKEFSREGVGGRLVRMLKEF